MVAEEYDNLNTDASREEELKARVAQMRDSLPVCDTVMPVALQRKLIVETTELLKDTRRIDGVDNNKIEAIRHELCRAIGRSFAEFYPILWPHIVRLPVAEDACEDEDQFYEVIIGYTNAFCDAVEIIVSRPTEIPGASAPHILELVKSIEGHAERIGGRLIQMLSDVFPATLVEMKKTVTEKMF